MIKVGIISDLHSEFWRPTHFAEVREMVCEALDGADLILMPGDIGIGAQSVELAADWFPKTPVFMVAGNHEFYGGNYETVLEDLSNTDCHGRFFHRTTATLTIRDVPVRIIGATLWTDFELFGDATLGMLDASRMLNDYRMIRHDGWCALRPQDTLKWHQLERAWIISQLDDIFDGITILMTHHSPVSFAIGPQYVNDALSPAFASRMETLLLRDDLPLVVWGHTHHCVDRLIDKTRFVSSQTGYIQRAGVETNEYGKLIEVSQDD